MKKRIQGRGKHYGIYRRTLEGIARRLFARDWPARAWNRFPSASKVCIVRRTLSLGREDFLPCRIVFLSDLHIGPSTPIPLLEKAFAIVNALRPSVLLLGGDYVFLGAPPSSLKLLSTLVASVECRAKFAVMGNHDLWTHDHRIVNALESAGTVVLVNKSCPLPPPWQGIVIVGLDDPWTGHCDGVTAFSQCDESTDTIVLCHSPDGLLHCNGNRFRLYVCGHTHSGQVATRRGAIFVPAGTLSRRFNSGFYRTDAGEVFVSSGIGAVGVPIRINAPPDLLCLNLVKKEMAKKQ